MSVIDGSIFATEWIGASDRSSRRSRFTSRPKTRDTPSTIARTASLSQNGTTSCAESTRASHVNLKGQLTDRGVVGPITLMPAGNAHRLGWQLAADNVIRRGRARLGGPRVRKDAATRSPFLHRLATSDGVLALVTEVLGPDVLLWGVSLQTRHPGHRHSWHVDIETAGAAPGSSVSVWIPLHGGGAQSALEVLPGSHTARRSLQEACAGVGVDRVGLTHSRVESLGKEAGIDSFVERIPALPGEAVVFDGRLWHASINESQSTRRALLLQYVAPDTQLLVPRPDDYGWPFTGDGTRAKCVLVSGTDEYSVNDVVTPP